MNEKITISYEKVFEYGAQNEVHEMTSQEAINRMAKALRSNIVETQAQCSCLNMAEAALNALLEGK